MKKTFLFYRSAVSMAIRKIQYAPTKPGRQPCTVVKKDFMFSPGKGERLKERGEERERERERERQREREVRSNCYAL